MSALGFPSALVSAQWISSKLDAENLIILDASVPPVTAFTQTRLPAQGKGRYLPMARRFDYDTQICNQHSSLPHMMPDTAQFTQQVRSLGVNKDSAVLVYDDVGVYASPRAWWMFRAMGHANVAVLDGGLPAWVLAGLPTSEALTQTNIKTGNFSGLEQPEVFCDAIAVYQNLHNDSVCILDARSAARFNGEAPEPRPGLRGGHMPGAKNLPFPEVLDDIFMKPVEELRKLFIGLVPESKKLIFSCGSGLTACILALAAELAGYDRISVYDGSWSEWGQPSKLPVVLRD
jgi:thiosulfate/3-mercaptopyruvate sulfurtransferase